MQVYPQRHPFEDTLLAVSAVILCTWGLDVIRKEAWSLYRTISGVRLYWELEEPKGPKGFVGARAGSGACANGGRACVTRGRGLDLEPTSRNVAQCKSISNTFGSFRF